MLYSLEFVSIVDLPDAFETAISDTEVEKQDIATAEAQLTQAEVELNTTMLSAQYNANATIVNFFWRTKLTCELDYC